MSELKETSNEVVAEAKTKETKKPVEVKAKDLAKSKKKDKVKKPNKIAQALKNTGKEIKKVTWPKFADVVKQTGVVLAVVFVFAFVIFGFDRLCSWLTGFLF